MAVTPYAPLCLCGIRGCGLYDLHATAFVTPRPAARKPKRGRWTRKR